MSSDGEIFLSDLSPRDKPWDEHKVNSRLVSLLLQEVDYRNLSDRMHRCSDLLRFRRFADQLTGDERYKLEWILSCHVRVCPCCQWRKSLAWVARIHQALPKLLEDYPKSRFVLLTLTARNCLPEELRANITALNKAWVRLTQRKEWPAIGFLKSVEVTRNSDKTSQWYGTAHPHIHALLVVEPSYFGYRYLNQKKWTDLWQSCLRIDYTPVINVKAVKPKPGRDIVDKDALMSSIKEVLKYSVKEADLIADQKWLAEIVNQLHKTRAVSIGGILRDYLSDREPDQEEMIHADEEEEEGDTLGSTSFGWRDTYGRYLKVFDS